MLKNEELVLVRGGALSTTLLNSLARLVNTLYELGQSVGSSIRRIASKKVCSIS